MVKEQKTKKLPRVQFSNQTSHNKPASDRFSQRRYYEP